jgi:hypothetical protein
MMSKLMELGELIRSDSYIHGKTGKQPLRMIDSVCKLKEISDRQDKLVKALKYTSAALWNYNDDHSQLEINDKLISECGGGNEQIK